MKREFDLAPITAFHPDMGIIQAEAAVEGRRFVDRLIEEWRGGANRFDRPGELILGGLREDRLFGFCGLNQDPYLNQKTIGRLRHLYVREEARRNGLASALVGVLLCSAKDVFDVVRLRTDNPAAAEFYAQLGFRPVDDPTATHSLFLR